MEHQQKSAEEFTRQLLMHGIATALDIEENVLIENNPRNLPVFKVKDCILKTLTFKNYSSATKLIFEGETRITNLNFEDIGSPITISFNRNVEIEDLKLISIHINEIMIECQVSNIEIRNSRDKRINQLDIIPRKDKDGLRGLKLTGQYANVRLNRQIQNFSTYDAGISSLVCSRPIGNCEFTNSQIGDWTGDVISIDKILISETNAFNSIRFKELHVKEFLMDANSRIESLSLGSERSKERGKIGTLRFFGVALHRQPNPRITLSKVAVDILDFTGFTQLDSVHLIDVAVEKEFNLNGVKLLDLSIEIAD